MTSSGTFVRSICVVALSSPCIVMPPKTPARRSQRYSGVLNKINEERASARKKLKELKAQKKAEDRKHRKLVKAASKLDARDLMELAGLRKLSLKQLVDYCQELGVDHDGVATPSSAAAASTVPGPEEPVIDSEIARDVVPDAAEEDSHFRIVEVPGEAEE